MTPLDGDAKPLSKSQQVARGPKRPSRQKAGPARWEQIVAAKGSVCRICAFCVSFPQRAQELGVTPDGCAGLGVSYHHLLSRSRGGADTESNIVPLGGSGTTGHHGDVEARRAPALRALAEALFSEEIAYLAEHVGEAWPERVFGVTYTRV